jgi:hypothetical protein
MNKILLLSLLMLNSCALDNFLSGMNNKLEGTNKALNGDLSSFSSDKDTKNNETKIKNNTEKSTQLLDADCDSWAKKSYQWHMYDSKKAYSQTQSTHQYIYAKRENEIIKLEAKLVRLCIQDNDNSAHGSTHQMPNVYIDKLGKDGFYH